MMISQADGDKLTNYFIDHPEKSLVMSATFKMKRPDNRVEYDMWYSSADERALDFLVDFKTYADKLGKKALGTPHYFLWQC